MKNRLRVGFAAWAVVGVLSACATPSEAPPGGDDTPDGIDTLVDNPPGGRPAVMRRLTVREYDASVRALLGDAGGYGAIHLPADAFTPFDDDVAWQEPSEALVAGAERAALAAATALRRDPARLEQVVGCALLAGDVACMQRFVERFGRRALRRPLGPDEVDELVDFAMTEATATGDPADGVALVVAALLQDGAFLYRIETGEPLAEDPARMRLDAWSTAARMAFLITGAPPTDALLDAAAAGQLDTEAGRLQAATSLLADPAVEAHVAELHAMWLGYRVIPEVEAVAASLRAEADALVHRVIFEDEAPWTTLWTAQYAWLDAASAAFYGFNPDAIPTGRAWVDLTGSGRSGLLSQGAFMSVANNPLDTSPTKRGKLILTRLMCQPVGSPPPNVANDVPPAQALGSCKRDRYEAHAADAACASCHAKLDGIGLGLERYGRTGGYREFETFPFTYDVNPDCPIPAGGEVPGLGSFETPQAFADLLVDSGALPACSVRHLLAFARGEPVSLLPDPDVDTLGARFEAEDGRFDRLLAILASSEALAVVEVDP